MRYILLFILLFNISYAQDTLKGKAVKIADGDTFTLLIENNEQIKVRLFGIDCPERGQDFGAVATSYTKDFLNGKSVLVESKGKDRYGRVLAFVFVDSVCLNEQLLKEGLAWHYEHFFKSEKYANLQIEAQLYKVGLWSRKDAIAPWEFRKLSK